MNTADTSQRWRKRPVVIEAVRWWRNGDHPDDGDGVENEVVRFYRRPDDPGSRLCQHCGREMFAHGWIDTLEGGHVVCPGDWVITGVAGEFYPCKDSIFRETYEPALAASGAPDDVREHMRVQDAIEEALIAAGHDLPDLSDVVFVAAETACAALASGGAEPPAGEDERITDPSALVVRLGMRPGATLMPWPEASQDLAFLAFVIDQLRSVPASSDDTTAAMRAIVTAAEAYADSAAATIDTPQEDALLDAVADYRAALAASRPPQPAPDEETNDAR